MLKRTITCTDYNGVERTEDHWFNFTEAELMEMELSVSGGLTENVRRMVDGLDGPSIVKMFKKIILDAYGVKSPDGKRFIKSEELKNEFAQTPAYSQLFMELATDDVKAAEFIRGIIPAQKAEQINIAAVAPST